jgi:hypothetical protein
MDDTTAEQRNKREKQLTHKYKHKQILFEETGTLKNVLMSYGSI